MSVALSLWASRWPALSALLLAACGSTPSAISDPESTPDESVEEESSALTMAEPDDGDPAIVAVMAAMPGEPPSMLCTGTLIGPRAILTAAHCLNDTEAVPLRVAFGSDTETLVASLRVVDRRIHPDYRSEPLAEHDLAILALEHAVTDAPVALARGVLDGSAVGDSLRLVGFGLSAPAGSFGQKRTGTARIDAVDDTRFRVAPAPSLTCYHDSGAPALSTTDEGEALLGVTTSGDSDCSTFSRFTRVDRYVDDFIVPSLAVVDALPVPPPEPLPHFGGCAVVPGHDIAPAAADLALALALALVTKRRRRT